MQVQMEARGYHWSVFINHSSILFFELASLTKPRIVLSQLPSAGVVDMYLLTQLFMWLLEDLNSDPHPCAANILATEPSHTNPKHDIR